MLIRLNALGAALAEMVGQGAAVLMRGHSATVVGAGLRQAVFRAVYLEVGGGVPVHWSWSDLRGHVERAGELLTAEEVERRVLVLDNPPLPSKGRATNSLTRACS